MNAVVSTAPVGSGSVNAPADPVPAASDVIEDSQENAVVNDI